MPLELLTSFSPNPARIERQRACLATWLQAGCHVVAVQAPDELVDLGDLGATVEWIERPSAPPLLSDLWAVAEARRGFVLLLNSDVELSPGFALPGVYGDALAAAFVAISEALGDGLLALRRWNYAAGTDWRRASRELWGIDGFYFRADQLRPFDGKAFAIGRPVWDWWLPLCYGRAKRAVYEYTDRLLLHEAHALIWSDTHWEDYMRLTVDPRSAHKARNRQFLGAVGHQLTEELRRTLRPMPERIVA